MLTRDPTLIKWFDPPDGYFFVSGRVYGFLCGYVATYGKNRDYSSDPEYAQGWEEGKSLRFDEMVSDHRANWKSI